MKLNNTLMDDQALIKAGYDLLFDHFGLVEAAHFISLVNSNRFDYTEWRKEQPFMDMSIEEFADAAMADRKARQSWQFQQERPSL